VPGSNGRTPACKPQAAAAVYCYLSLRPLGKHWAAPGRCGLLRCAASTRLPRPSACQGIIAPDLARHLHPVAKPAAAVVHPAAGFGEARHFSGRYRHTEPE
jgi:hypothetical protein